MDIQQFIAQVNECIFYLDDIKGFRLLKQIRRIGKNLVTGSAEAYDAFVALQFLCIPMLEKNEIADLFHGHIMGGLQINDCDITERLRKKLVMIDLSDRDKYKEELKQALVRSEEQVVSAERKEKGKKPVTVAEWLRDYQTYIREGQASLVRAQYYQQTYVRKLTEEERQALKKLFALYDFLSVSSFTPEGFEDDLLLRTEDGRLVTTNRGQVVTLYNPQKSQKKPVAAPTVLPIAREKEDTAVMQLQDLAAQYPAGSLERRAIEEEIRNLQTKNNH